MSDKPIQQDIKRKFYKNDRWLLIIWIAILYSVVNGYSWPQTTPRQWVERLGILLYLFSTIIFAAKFKNGWLKALIASQGLVALWSMTAFDSPVLSFISPIPALLFEEMLLGKRLSRPPYITIIYSAIALFLILYRKEMNIMSLVIVFQAVIGLLITIRVAYYNLSSLVRQTEEIVQTNIKLNEANKKVADLTAEKVRQEVARDLHDTLTQDLVGINMRLTVINQLAAKDDFVKAKEMIEQTQEMTETSIMQSRRLIKEYRNPDLVEGIESLKKATLGTIAIVKKDYSLNTKLMINKDCELSTSQQVDVQRVIGEALMNVVKHGKTNEAEVTININGKRLTVEIINHGETWDPATKLDDHFGIKNMQERANKYNGDVRFNPLDKGLKVTATFDIKGEKHSGTADQTKND